MDIIKLGFCSLELSLGWWCKKKNKDFIRKEALKPKEL